MPQASSATSRAGKITAASAASPDQATHLADLGVRVLFVGVDISLKRRILAQSLAGIKDALGTR